MSASADQAPDGAAGAAPPSFAGRRLPLLVGVVGFVIVAALSGFVLASTSDDSGGRSGGPDVTDPARWDLPTLDGTGRVRLADFQGTPVVVNFFASWCEPCKKELPEFVDASKRLEGKVEFVAVNSKEITASAGMSLARRFGLAEAGITLARDVGGQSRSGLHDSYEVRNAMPITAFYDSAGNLKSVEAGQLNRDKLGSRLQEFFGVSL
ncbi:MAG TPA: TlpA family protein disulfide reductase [Acidimicrobiia bacterium]|nr:TlpA family protein disulfide reductase [Acidimicrobiia bacterium]